MKKVPEVSGNFFFEEKQGFPKWLLQFILIIIGSSVLLVAVITVALSHSKEGQDAWIGLAISLPIEIITFLLFNRTRFEKIVTSEGLHYRWMPFQTQYRVIPKEIIASYELRKTPAMKYGSATVPGYGKVFNMNDGQGIQFYLNNGKKLFISSEETYAFLNAIEKLAGNSKTATVYGWKLK